MPKPVLHVLIIPSWFPHSKNDVRGSFFVEHAHALQQEKLQVGVIYPQLNSLTRLQNIWQSDYGFRTEKIANLPVYRHTQMNWFPKLPQLTSKWWLYLGKKLLARYIVEQGMPDIIHAQATFDAGFLAAYAKAQYGIPFVLSEHSSAFARGLLNQHQLLATKPIIAMANLLTAVSPAFANRLNAMLPTAKIWQIMPNMVEDAFFTMPLKNIAIEPFRFAVICAHNANKSVSLAIDAFAQFNQLIPNSELIIAGDGPLSEKLKQQAKESHASKHIIFTGKLNKAEVLQTLQDSHALLQTSQYETFSVIVAEAQALGKPVISTLCEGPESIITATSGILVECNNVRALSQAMLQCHQQYAQYNAQAIRLSCQSRFAAVSIAKQWHQHYKDIVCA